VSELMSRWSTSHKLDDKKANLIARATSIPFIHRALLGISKLKAKLGKISAECIEPGRTYDLFFN
jgi:hypothetical protein